MRAFVKKSGISDKVSLAEVAKPEAGEHEMLIKIKAIGIGIHDEYFHAPNVNYPYVIGIEAAGVVEEIGASTTNYSRGDRIAFISMMQPKGGTWAEYAVISEKSLILNIPNDMSYEQAAAIPVPGNTALKALAGTNSQPNDSLFVAGGAGAIGTLLIQIAKANSLQVIASASKKNHALMQQLGADFVVDYHDNDWQSQVKEICPNGVDVAIAIHPGTPQEVQKIIKDHGTLVAVSGDDFAAERDIALKGVPHNIDIKNELAELVDKINNGEVEQIIGKTYPFEEAVDALEQVKTRHTRGKLVLKLRD